MLFYINVKYRNAFIAFYNKYLYGIKFFESLYIHTHTYIPCEILNVALYMRWLYKSKYILFKAMLNMLMQYSKDSHRKTELYL